MNSHSNDAHETVSSMEPPWDRRQLPRIQKSRSVALIPVLLDGGPGQLQWADADTEDISPTGASVQLSSDTQLPCRTIVVGAESDSGSRVFATLEIVSQKLQNDTLRIGGRWAIGTADDVLLSDKLRPRVDPRTLTFVYGWSEETLDQWCRLGVLRQFLVDRVLLCSRCGSIPSWRRGCHVCGSGRIHRDRLIHHFACAHVGRANEFETASGLQCPKCRTANLIVGSDFEFIEGPVQCYDCNASGGQPTLAGMCHRCHRRFSMDEAEERLLYAYHVERLDPLNFYTS